MASIQVRKKTNCLIIDFYYRGTRCREQTALDDTPANRKKVQKLIDRIEADIAAGFFDYSQYFPSSKIARKLSALDEPSLAGHANAGIPSQGGDVAARDLPLFRDFTETWFMEKEVEWRKSHRIIVRADIDKLLIPQFGD